jgi:glutaredoxin
MLDASPPRPRTGRRALEPRRWSLAARVVAAVAGAGVLASAPAQTMYKSVTPDGRTVYSDAPPSGARVEKTLKFTEPPSSPLPPATAFTLQQMQRAGGTGTGAGGSSAYGTVLFSATWCGYCKQAKAYLTARKIAYRDVDIDTQDGLAEFAHAGASKGIPLLISGSTRLQGFSSDAYDEVFDHRK